MTLSTFCRFFVSLAGILAYTEAGAGEIAPAMRGVVQPQVAVASDGRIHVVFGKGSAIFHVSSADGRGFSEPVKVGTLGKLALGMRRGPRIAAGGKLVSVTAISHSDGNVHVWISADAGATWKEGAKLNDAAKSAREGLHAMAGDGRGLVITAWLDQRSGGAELWSATSRDGGGTWGANTLVYRSPDGHICECCHPSAAVNAQGHIAVMWRNWLGGARDLYTAISTNGGKSFGPAQKSGAGTWRLEGCPMDGGGVILTAADKPLAAWRREGTVFSAGGVGQEQKLANSGAQPAVALGRDGPIYVWESDGGLMLQRGASAPTRLAEGARMPAIAARPGGGAVVVWELTARETLQAEVVP